MAVMLPPTISSDTRSPAERTVWQALHDDLDDRWTVLHSLGLVSHPVKHWAEIDFVLVGPDGIYCLEVKGGLVGRTDGKWFSESKSGRINDLGKGPFDQVGGAEAALRRHLKHELGRGRSYLSGYGVVTPDCLFTARGADIEPDLVYDGGDADKPFSVYIRRLADYWKQRYPHSEPLTTTECRRAVEALRGDFALVRSLRSTLKGIAGELLALTQEQLDAVEEFDENEHVLISGGAGTGKTLLAVEAARQESRAGRRVLLCCYNVALAEMLSASLADEPTVEVTHFHGLTTRLIREAGLEDQLPKADTDELFDLYHPELASDALLVLDKLGGYDALVLDEAQDLLSPPNLEFFEACLRGGLKDGRWRIFLDANQDLYSGSAIAATELLNSLQPARRRLKKNCRNTKPVAVFTALLTGFDLAQTLVVDGPDVEYHFYRDDGHQDRLVTHALNRLRRGGVDASDIVLLTRRRRNKTLFRSPLNGGPKIEDLRADRRLPTAIRHSTIAGFKGLESPVVVVADVDDVESREARIDLYVALSRATSLLIVLLNEQTRAAFDALATNFGRKLAGAHSGSDLDEAAHAPR